MVHSLVLAAGKQLERLLVCFLSLWKPRLETSLR